MSQGYAQPKHKVRTGLTSSIIPPHGCLVIGIENPMLLMHAATNVIYSCSKMSMPLLPSVKDVYLNIAALSSSVVLFSMNSEGDFSSPISIP